MNSREAIAKLRPFWRHQTEAIEFARKRASSMLHMGMRTGKSRVALELCRDWEAQRVLVLAPLTVVADAWHTQIQLFGHGFRFCLLGARILTGWKIYTRDGEGAGWTDEDIGRKKPPVKFKSEVFRRELQDADETGHALFVAVNYESARSGFAKKGDKLERGSLAAALAFVDWDVIILDESQKLKDPFGTTQRFVWKKLRAAHWLALTGTPAPHSPMDLFAQFRILDPRIFGWSFVQHRDRYAVMGGWDAKEIIGYQNEEEMREKIARLTFQVGREVLDLPPAQHIRVEVDLSAKAQRAYDELDALFRTEVLGGEINAANALTRLIRLQQITSGWAAVDTEDDTADEGAISTRLVDIDHAKQDALFDLLSSTDEPVVVFCLFRADLDAVRSAVRSAGKTCSELSGRAKELPAWQAGETDVLAAQIQAGGIGIDLSRAPICIMYSIGFSGGDYDQAIARIHGPGSKKPVAYYHLIARGTVDESKYGALRAKKKVVAAILDDIKAMYGNEEGAA